jgi:rhodanese-related sulfurtransferase
MLGFLFKPKGHSLSAAEAKALLDAGEAILVDVREDKEWAAGHIPGALHAPLSRFAEAGPKLPKGKRVILYCLSGMRSGQALGLCGKLGLSIDTQMAGGINAWRQAGLPVQ